MCSALIALLETDPAFMSKIFELGIVSQLVNIYSHPHGGKIVEKEKQRQAIMGLLAVMVRHASPFELDVLLSPQFFLVARISEELRDASSPVDYRKDLCTSALVILVKGSFYIQQFLELGIMDALEVSFRSDSFELTANLFKCLCLILTRGEVETVASLFNLVSLSLELHSLNSY